VRLIDVFGIALSALWQQRMRTFLTTLGVVGGSFVLITSLSIGEGVQLTIVREYNRYVDLRRIDVRASTDKSIPPPEQEIKVVGKMTDDKRKRLEEEKKRRWQMTRPNTQRIPISREKIRALEKIAHVKQVSPFVYQWGRMYYGRRSEPINITGSPVDHPLLEKRLVAGKGLAESGDNAVLINEFTLYKLGITDDADIERVIGSEITVKIAGETAGGAPDLLLGLMGLSSTELSIEEERLLLRLRKEIPELLREMPLSTDEKQTLQKLLERPAREKSPRSRPRTKEASVQVGGLAEATGTVGEMGVTLTICGVIRCSSPNDTLQPGAYRGWAIDNSDLVLSDNRAEQLFFETYPGPDQGLDVVVVEVDHIDNVAAVNAEIKGMGFETWCVYERLETERFIYLLLSAAMTLIALVALGVAALGITNTMRMSVLERTREIGIMKAVGARDLHLLLIFLIEGTLIGVTGSLIGLLLAWLVSFPGDAWVKSYVAKRIEVDLKDSVFDFPWWLIVGAPLLVTLITTIAAVLPARKASRVNPITALRHD